MDVQERLNLGREALGDNVLPSKEEVIFLYDLIQDLQEENKEWKRTAQSYYVTKQELREQNKRYKEALKSIYNDTFYESEHEWVSPIHVIRKRAEKALENSEG